MGQIIHGRGNAYYGCHEPTNKNITRPCPRKYKISSPAFLRSSTTNSATPTPPKISPTKSRPASLPPLTPMTNTRMGSSTLSSRRKGCTSTTTMTHSPSLSSTNNKITISLINNRRQEDQMKSQSMKSRISWCPTGKRASRYRTDGLLPKILHTSRRKGRISIGTCPTSWRLP